MRPGIGQNVSCEVDDFTKPKHIVFREMWFVDYSCNLNYTISCVFVAVVGGLGTRLQLLLLRNDRF